MKNMIIKIAVAIFIFLLQIKSYGINMMLKVAFVPNLPPYQFEENRNYMGVHIDILNSIAEKNNYIIEYIPMENNTQCMEALSNEKVDIVLGIINTSSTKLKEQTTENLSQSSICMVALEKHADEIKNKLNSGGVTAAVEAGTVEYSYARKIGNLRSIVVSNQVKALEMLTSGKVDVVVGVRNSILYQLEKNDIQDEYTIINNYMIPIQYAMVTRNGDKDLLKKLNNGIQQLRVNGDYERINEKWINENKYIIKEFLTSAYKIVATLIMIITVIFLFNIRLNILLKRQVYEKTKKLQEINEDLKNQIIETRNNKELKNNIVEHSPGGIIAFDMDYKITIFNQSACKLTGLRDFPIGQDVFEIPLIKNVLNDKIDSIFAGDLKIINEETTLKDESGDESRSYRYGIYQLYNYDNSIRGAIINLEDITEELKIKEEIFAKEKNKVLNQIIAGIAHEIRNPLTSIKAFVQLMPAKIDNQQFKNQFIEFVPKEVDRVDNLIKDLIDYTKPQKSNKEAVRINEIIRSCSALIGPSAESKGIALIIAQEDDLTINADKNQIKQVLINILLNSMDSIAEKIENNEIKEKLHIYIKAWKDNGYVFVQIVDEGMGMTREKIKKSTEPFYTTKFSGTGLGLALSKQYTENNDGTMVIESVLSAFTKITLKFRR